jgi:hypothetical protein
VVPLDSRIARYAGYIQLSIYKGDIGLAYEISPMYLVSLHDCKLSDTFYMVLAGEGSSEAWSHFCSSTDNASG